MKKMIRKGLFFGLFVMVVIFLARAFLFAVEHPGQVEAIRLEHIPIEHFNYGETVLMRGAIVGGEGDVYFFFRAEGMEEFQVRKMTEEANGVYIFEFDTSLLTSLQVEYYLEARVGDKSFFYPLSAPHELVKMTGESREPLPEIPANLPLPTAEAKITFPVNLSLNLEKALMDSEEEMAEQEGTQTVMGGNTRFFPSYQSPTGSAVRLEANFSYTNNPLPMEKKIDLSNLIISFTSGYHGIRIGDINISESSMTVSGLGRRGVEYSLDNQKTSFHLFDISSQQVQGFKGFGIPRPSLSIYGGSLKQAFLNEQIYLKAVYIGGKDNPQEGVNVAASPFYGGREGRVIALEGEAKLFEQKFNLTAELARSKYDEDVTDEALSTSDNALNLGANFSAGGFNLQTTYSYVGKNFNSIGLQSMANDREGYQAIISLSRGIFNLTSSYLIERDNVQRDPAQSTTKDKNGNLELSLTFSPRVAFNIGYRRDSQSSSSATEETISNANLMNEISSSLNLMLSDRTQINLSLRNSNQKSEASPENEMATLSLNLGGSFRPGEILSFSPSFSYSRSSSPFTGLHTSTYSSLLNGEIYFIPQTLYFIFSGGFNRMEMNPEDITNIINLNGGLNLSLGHWLKFAQLNLAVNGDYNRRWHADSSFSHYRILLKVDFAF